MQRPALVAWDFDGVLNRNIVDGAFLWHRDFERDFGVSARDFQTFVFRSGRFDDVLVGRRDILDLLAEWAEAHGASHAPETVLDYWLERDAQPDAEVLGWVQASGLRSVIATNNEARRADHIWTRLGYSQHMEAIFAAGPMGTRKPLPDFFAAIETWSGLSPDAILLVDDAEENIAAAHRRGWRAFHFTDETRHRLPGLLGVT